MSSQVKEMEVGDKYEEFMDTEDVSTSVRPYSRMRFVHTLTFVFFASWICAVNSSISTIFKRYFDDSGKGKDVKVTLYGRVFCAELERQVNATNTTSHTRHRRHISLEELYSAHGYSSSVRSDDDLFDNAQTVEAIMKQPGNDRILRSNRGQLRRQHQVHFGDGHDSHNGEALFRSYGFEDSDEGEIRPSRHPSPHQHNSWEHQMPSQKRQPLPPRPPQHHEESHWDSSQSPHKPPRHPEEGSWKPSKPQHSGEVSSHHARPDEPLEDTFWSPSHPRPKPPQHHQEEWNPSHSPSPKLIRPNNNGPESGEWLPERRPAPRPRLPAQTTHSSAEDEEWSGSMRQRPKPASPHVPQWSGESMTPLQPKTQAQEEKDRPELPQKPTKPVGLIGSTSVADDAVEVLLIEDGSTSPQRSLKRPIAPQVPIVDEKKLQPQTGDVPLTTNVYGVLCNQAEVYLYDVIMSSIMKYSDGTEKKREFAKKDKNE
ncbi:hypothetical protein DdX_06139 [Ditylenchus destructor]|uniref:Uncharacterized protein n=1 Tax=Ditylenchus destructor TaxID=166010 RepID=A0AAD4R9I5_9BILA|nr:hypothetical protein DdX_06139 [Ditylenchus destructor]